VKVEYINPFIESVLELFATMLGASAQRGELGLCKESGNAREITGLIDLSGPAPCTVALSFPTGTALAMCGRLLKMETHVIDETVCDAVAELVNIVAGSAQAKLNAASEAPIGLSLPTVVRGNSNSADSPSSAMWLEVPFTSDLGPFNLRVNFETSGLSAKGTQSP
jgi:chemotaxis protein CheX